MRMLRIKHVSERTGMSRASIYRMMKTGEFPQPVKLTDHLSAWPEPEVDEWLRERIENHRRSDKRAS